jgi:hypothetical protein
VAKRLEDVVFGLSITWIVLKRVETLTLIGADSCAVVFESSAQDAARLVFTMACRSIACLCGIGGSSKVFSLSTARLRRLPKSLPIPSLRRYGAEVG